MPDANNVMAASHVINSGKHEFVMTKTITRRDMLKFAGGGVLGALFTPLPWKLLDDSAIWTQNWSLTPKLTHGPVTTITSRCTLCSGGCAVSARCLSGMPFYLSGVAADPLSRGTLCARGIAAHHMAVHPLRITHPHIFTSRDASGSLVPLSMENGIAKISEEIRKADGPVVVFDQRPHRMISALYRRFTDALPVGRYVVSPTDESTMLRSLQKMSTDSSVTFAYDLEKVSYILSFGTPLLDGWGTVGFINNIRRHTTIVQAESRYSRTAQNADRWIPLRPGAEKYFALSLAQELLTRRPIRMRAQKTIDDFARMEQQIAQFPTNVTASYTGAAPDIVREVADQLSTAVSPLVISSADPGGGPKDPETEQIIALLNVLLGAVGRNRGIGIRKEHQQETTLNDLPDGSVSVLIIDAVDSGYALPWHAIERKLHPERRFVVSLAPILNEYSAHADLLMPAPAPFEQTADIPAPVTFHRSVFALSAPLMTEKTTTVDPFTVVNGIAQTLNLSVGPAAFSSSLDERLNSLFADHRGSVVEAGDGRTHSVASISSVDELKDFLMKGGVWMDDTPIPPKTLRWKFGRESISHHTIPSLSLLVSGKKGMSSCAHFSPILSKIFQESELYRMNGTVSIHPATGTSLGLIDRRTALLTTERASRRVRVMFSPSVPPGVVEAEVAPNANGTETPLHPDPLTVLEICPVRNDGTWNGTPVTLTAENQ